jgi:hypothetical protein
VESNAVGIGTVSIPDAESTGKTTVRAHFPKQERSWIASAVGKGFLLPFKFLFIIFLQKPQPLLLN